MPEISSELSIVLFVLAVVVYGVLRRVLRRFLLVPLRRKMFSNKRYIKFWRW